MNQSNTQDNARNDAQIDESAMQDELQTQQVIDLQMSMAHLEMTVERLDAVIARQDRDIQTLQRQLQLIYKQVDSQDTETGIAPFDVMADRPPHY
ncbi:SlyX family protein [Psychrobacter sp. NZS113]|uniref:SlyX family protein n=1 Tax=Psychrobacter sp. NZS113 TaxID=2792045 RepID=UPI0018CDD4FD|nr:SlyX family protein [Psychrobacter sp. NZS113]MBH0096119.1 SlyX family protein [Psychrobacter sp. NZS113]